MPVQEALLILMIFGGDLPKDAEPAVRITRFHSAPECEQASMRIDEMLRGTNARMKAQCMPVEPLHRQPMEDDGGWWK